MRTLKQTLSILYYGKITTQKALQAYPSLYAELFVNIKSFITSEALATSVNSNRLVRLENLGADTDDITMDLLVKTYDKLDSILSLDLGAMVPYMTTMVTNHLIDVYRAIRKKTARFVSLDEVISSNKVANNDSRKTITRENYLMDKKASIETNYLAKETVFDLYKKYCDNADVLLVKLGTTVMGDKVREIADRLVNAGSVSSVLNDYLEEISAMYNIDLDTLPAIAPVKKTGLTKVYKKDAVTKKDFSAKISSILNRNK